MKLVFIYGPAASGKLTVARELGGRTGFAVFHNHLVVDMLTPVFAFGSPHFVELREKVWLEVLNRAADDKLNGVIFTFTPERTVRPQFVVDLTEAMESAGAETVFVELNCPNEELERRMANTSRIEYGKVQSVVQYRSLRESGAFDYPPITKDRLTIDTSKLEPAEASDRILEYIGMNRK